MRCTTSSGLHARAASAARAATAARGLRTPDLLGTCAAQERLDLTRARRLAGHEDPELVVREAGIVGDCSQAARGEERVEENSQDGRQGTEQDRHLEHDHDVRRDRADGLAAQHQGPVVRHVQGEPRADGAAGDAPDQREHPDRAHRLIEGVLDLVARDRRIHREVRVPGRAQPTDRIHRGVQVAEYGQHAWRRRRVEDRGQRVHQLHAAATFPRCGAGRTSFTSEIDTAGNVFTNSRNHMKNHPKLPAMMPQSAQVGLYVAFANRSNGSPASDTTMITKRSNHIPMFTKIEMTNRPVMLVWTFFDQRSHGSSPLQMFIVQLAHQNGPNARYQNAARSCALPLNQATKFSVQYDMLTIRPVKRQSFARFSKWWTVMMSSK